MLPERETVAGDEKASADTDVVEAARDRVEGYLESLTPEHPDSWKLCEAWGSVDGPQGVEEPCMETGARLMGEAWQLASAVADWWDTHGDLGEQPDLEELLQSILGVVELGRLEVTTT